ncbi:MAG TPA: hypothetical protein VMG82_18575 [Candidatus Sulfotelmatobacter sp.]|nr:hypothetical protein [Candidatus Sulfotelmatobacter sp.]
MSGMARCVSISVITLFAYPLLAREPVVVQSAQCQDWVNYSATYQCSFRNPTSAANAAIVFALVSGAPSTTVTSVTDDHKPAANVYVQDLHYVFGDVQSIHFYSCPRAGKARTITLNANGSTHFQVILMEVAGLAPQQPLLDRTSARDNGYNSGPTFTSGPTDTTTKAVELLIGWTEQAYPNVMTFTDTPPWRLVEQEPIGGSRIAYRVSKSLGTYEYTGSFSGPGDYRVGAAIVTYRAADD